MFQALTHTLLFNSFDFVGSIDGEWELSKVRASGQTQPVHTVPELR